MEELLACAHTALRAVFVQWALPGEIKATKVVFVSVGTFPIELCLMYDRRPQLAARAKYRKLSFMLCDAILSGQGWFMSLSGTMESWAETVACAPVTTRTMYLRSTEG